VYQVLARKWRPQLLEELVGQPHVVRILRNAVESGRLAHAYLFAGVRGTGKTTVARILAKCVNCESGPTAEPCNRCTPCVEIAESRSMDVMELDAASRNRVDDVRELQELLSYAPVRDRYKVLIFDEAHMLSAAASNALLKTIEEPPPRVLFVLATTEIRKILPTILSRCQVFDFRRVPAREVASHLRRLCGEEGLEVSDAVLDRIARAGEGSVRDALSVLERVVASCGSKVSDEDALEILGAVRAEVLLEMTSALAAGDAGRMLSTLDAVVNEGRDLLHFWGEWIGVLRDLLLMRSVPGREDLLDRPAEEARSLAASAETLGAEDIERALHVLADLEPGLRASGQPRYLFEATLVRLASLGHVRPIEEVLSRLSDAAPKKARAGGPPPGAADERPRPTPRGDVAREVVSAVQRERPMLGAALGQAVAVRVDGDSIVVEFPSGAAPLRRMLERESRVFEECAARVAGRPLAVRLETAGEAPTADLTEPRIDSTRPSPTPPRRGGRVQGSHELLQSAKRDPGVRLLMDELGAQIVDVRPDRRVGPETEEGGTTPLEDDE